MHVAADMNVAGIIDCHIDIIMGIPAGCRRERFECPVRRILLASGHYHLTGCIVKGNI